jgi:hypothetical protein
MPVLASADVAVKACSLLTPAEIEAALGSKLSNFTESGPFCNAKGANRAVMLRIARKTGEDGAEAKGIEMMKKMGVQVDVKTFGAITCSTLLPPSSLAAQVGFNTTCSITKGDTVAAIEVTTSAQQDMVPIEKLRPLAEKMAERFDASE